nr:immunoglobulin kappa light chain-like [Anolis sagrei ordinatus]
MALALLFLVLLNFYAGVHSQGMLTQPDTVSGSPGQMVTLSCTKSGGDWSNHVHWFQQKSGGVPRYVHGNGYNRGPGIPDRFTATASGNIGSLTITNVQAEDEADYYCLCWFSTGSSKEGETSGQLLVCFWKPNPFGELTMVLALLLLVLLNYYAGVHSQGLIQTASMSGSLGQTATLSCTKGSGNWNSAVYWIQQKSGEGPCFVHCNGCSSRGPGIPDRFTASISGNTGSLTITNLQAGDEADYYCLCWYSTGSSYHSGSFSWGKGSLFPPPQDERKENLMVNTGDLRGDVKKEDLHET